MYNRYDQISTLALIRAIQDIAVKLADKEAVKKTGQGRVNRMKTEINEMRRSVIPRLVKMDRSSPKFFPPGALVIYHQKAREPDLNDWTPRAVQPDKHGRVVELDTDKVLVQFEGERFFVRVDPLDLKIKHIR